jgi:hypothetical protein
MSVARRYFPLALASSSRLVEEFIPELATKSARPSFHPRRVPPKLFLPYPHRKYCRKNPTSYGQPCARYGKSNHDLRTPCSIFGMAALSKTRSRLRVLISLVY